MIIGTVRQWLLDNGCVAGHGGSLWHQESFSTIVFKKDCVAFIHGVFRHDPYDGIVFYSDPDLYKKCYELLLRSGRR